MGMIRKRSITDQQRDFVNYLVRKAKTPQRRQGWQDTRTKQSAGFNQKPSIALLMRQTRQTVYQTELASLSADTLRNVMLDVDAPASAKVSAARTALELAGDLGKNADDPTSNRSLAEMSPDELATMIDRWESERAELAKDITTAQE